MISELYESIPDNFFLEIDNNKNLTENLERLGFKPEIKTEKDWLKNALNSNNAYLKLFVHDKIIYDVTADIPSEDQFIKNSFDLPENTRFQTFNLTKIVETLDNLEKQDIKRIHDDSYLYYRNLPKHRKSENVSLEAVKKDYFDIKYVPEESMSERVILKAVNGSVQALESIPQSKITNQISDVAFNNSSRAIKYLSDEWKSYDKCLKAVSDFCQHIKYVPEKFRDAGMSEAFRKSFIPESHDDFKSLSYINHSDTCLDILKSKSINKEGKNCAFEILQNFKLSAINKDIAQEALNQDIRCLKFIPDNLLKDLNFPSLTAKEISDIRLVAGDNYHERNYPNLPEENKTEWVSYVAVKATDLNFPHVPQQTNSDRIRLEALKKDGHYLQEIKHEDRTDSMIRQAVRTTGTALEHIAPEKKDYDLCMDAVKQDGMALQFVPVKFRQTDLVREAINNTFPYDDERMGLISFIHEPELLKDFLEIVKGEFDADFYYLLDENVIDTPLAEYLVDLDIRFFMRLPGNVKPFHLCENTVSKDLGMLGGVPQLYQDKTFLNKYVNEDNINALIPHIRNMEYLPDNVIDSAIKHDFKNLISLPEKLKTRDRCEEALKTGLSVPGSSYILNYIPYEDIRTSGFKKYINRNPVYEVLENLGKDRQNEEIAKAATGKDARCYTLLYEKLKTPEVTLIMLTNWNKQQYKDFPEIPVDSFSEKVCKKICDRFPNDYLNRVPIDKQTPGDCLSVVRYNPYLEKLIPIHISSEKNIYTFNKSLEQMLGRSLPIAAINHIYNGGAMTVDKITIDGKVLRSQVVKYDNKIHKISYADKIENKQEIKPKYPVYNKNNTSKKNRGIH